MSYFRKSVIITAIASLATLASTSVSSANPYYGGSSPGFSSSGYSSSSLGVNQTPAQQSRLNAIQGSNVKGTASHYFRVGQAEFEKGNFEKAEYAFNAVLRAQGLNKQANYYLAKIGQAQGDEAKARKYALAFHGLKDDK